MVATTASSIPISPWEMTHVVSALPADTQRVVKSFARGSDIDDSVYKRSQNTFLSAAASLSKVQADFESYAASPNKRLGRSIHTPIKRALKADSCSIDIASLVKKGEYLDVKKIERVRKAMTKFKKGFETVSMRMYDEQRKRSHKLLHRGAAFHKGGGIMLGNKSAVAVHPKYR